MGLINFILNLAALLLWLGWREMASDPLLKNPLNPLARTLRRVGPAKSLRWKYLGGLAGLLLGRAAFFHWIGPTVNWTPHVDLGVIVLPFRSELFSRTLLFSLLSFVHTLAVFYLSLVLLSLVNRQATDVEPLQKLVRAYLGRIERLTFVFKLLLSPVLATVVWLGFSPLLAWWAIIPAASSLGTMVQQGLLIGVGMCLVWKHVIAGVLLLYFLNSYVYFGNQPLWNYVNLTARQFLKPVPYVICLFIWPLCLLLRKWPKRFAIGRMDFTPVAGIVLVYLLAELLLHWLPKIYPA